MVPSLFAVPAGMCCDLEACSTLNVWECWTKEFNVREMHEAIGRLDALEDEAGERRRGDGRCSRGHGTPRRTLLIRRLRASRPRSCSGAPRTHSSTAAATGSSRSASLTAASRRRSASGSSNAKAMTGRSYTLKEIGAFFGLHYAQVSGIARRGRDAEGKTRPRRAPGVTRPRRGPSGDQAAASVAKRSTALLRLNRPTLVRRAQGSDAPSSSSRKGFLVCPLPMPTNPS
jgi:hypothetical protein